MLFVFPGCAPQMPSSTTGNENIEQNYLPYIVNGEPDTQRLAVGRLEIGYQMCTATLIGKQTILTAAHCIHYPEEINGGYFWLYRDNETLPEPYYPKKIINHPGYVHKAMVPDQVGSFDISVIVLHKPVEGIAPYAISTSAPEIGQPITLVGYGATNDGENDQKSESAQRRQVDNSISKINPMTYIYEGEKNIWHGDSGGPTFTTINGQEIIVGNHSGGEYKKFGMDMRVDYFCAWLVQATNGDINLSGDKCPDYSPADGGLSDLAAAAASLPQKTETPAEQSKSDSDSDSAPPPVYY